MCPCSLFIVFFVVKRKPSVKAKDHRYKKQKCPGEKLRVEQPLLYSERS